jgi:hypothetical protein
MCGGSCGPAVLRTAVELRQKNTAVRSTCRPQDLLVPPYPGGIVGPKDDSRDFIAEEIGDELLVGVIAVKVNFIVKRRIIMHDFRGNLRFRPAAHHDFIYPHSRTIISITTYVQMHLIQRMV